MTMILQAWPKAIWNVFTMQTVFRCKHLGLHLPSSRRILRIALTVMILYATVSLISYVCTLSFSSNSLTLWIPPETFGYDTKHTNITGKRILSDSEVLKFHCLKQSSKDVVVKLPHKGYLSLDDFKLYASLHFVLLYANPAQKTGIPLKLRTFQLSEGRNPKEVLHDYLDVINVTEVENDVKMEREWRLAQGDDDMLQFKEVQEELTQTDYPVPNLVHFNWYGCHRFRVDHFITVLSSLRYQKPRVLFFHTNCEPLDSEYWLALKKIAGNVLKVMRRTMPTQLWGRPMVLPEHCADAARLQIMMEVGGIYLDTDSTMVRSLNPLRRHRMVLGEESQTTLAGAIIIANRTEWFLRRWYWEYKYYNYTEWAHTAVIVPWATWQLFPESLIVVKNLICRPNYQESRYIYQELYDWHSNFVVHLYTRLLITLDGRQERSLKELAVLNTTYGQIARHVIWGNEAILDVTDWLVECNTKENILT